MDRMNEVTCNLSYACTFSWHKMALLYADCAAIKLTFHTCGVSVVWFVER